MPPGAIIQAEGSRNTYEDAQWVSRRFTEQNLEKEIILVTSAAHMPRAVAIFTKQGFAVHAAPADFHMDESDHGFRVTYLLPSEACMYDTWYGLHEWVGWLVYRSLGWL